MDKQLTEKVKKLIIQFDSSSAFLHALAYFFHSKDFKAVGIAEGIPSWVGYIINSIPKKIRSSLYAWSGWFDAVDKKDLDQLNMEEVSRWVTMQYPKREYNGFMFGSSNGAAVHLAAALGFAWLPQTYLVALRRFMPADELKKDIEWGNCVINKFLRENPDILAHQMHDPIQDRLMIQKMGYFRMKRLKLGETFENFILNNRIKKGPLLLINCNYKWPSYRVSDRHLFQVGGYGGLEAYDYYKSGDKVKNFLKKMGSKVKKWEIYEPSGEYPEAEWGFPEESLPYVEEFCRKKKIPLQILEFKHPEELSLFTADLYEWWYLKRGRKTTRLLVENFGLIAPLDVLESNTIPFWLTFNTDNSYQNALGYIKNHPQFEEIFAMLMSNGVKDSIGLVKISDWKSLLKEASLKGEFIGVDERQYPLDFATFLKYNKDLKTKLYPRSQPPAALTLQELEEFVGKNPKKYSVKWKN